MNSIQSLKQGHSPIIFFNISRASPLLQARFETYVNLNGKKWEKEVFETHT